MARGWFVDGRGLARKVTNASSSAAQQIKDCGATFECSNCHYLNDNRDASPEWPGLPAGVKFEPSDEELLEHLAAKCGVGNLKPHVFLEDFIPTLEEDLGINYTHPENLPGAKKDGSSVFFFHRTFNAYATGQRKRRKIQCQHSLNEEPVRWHKTGKTKSFMKNGILLGCKKIMVLYKTSKKGSKPEKSKWAMHQYHLGSEGKENGEYVVSKIIYQHHKDAEKYDDSLMIEEANNLGPRISPLTPQSNLPNPPRLEKSMMQENTPTSSFQKSEYIAEGSNGLVPNIPTENTVGYEEWLAGECRAIEDCDFSESFMIEEHNNLGPRISPLTPKPNLPNPPRLEKSVMHENAPDSSFQGSGYATEASDGLLPNIQAENGMGYEEWLAGKSHAIEDFGLNGIDDSLLCKESFDTSLLWTNSRSNQVSHTGFGHNMSDVVGNDPGSLDLENLDTDTPPDFELADLQFCSQDSLLGWLDRI